MYHSAKYICILEAVFKRCANWLIKQEVSLNRLTAEGCRYAGTGIRQVVLLGSLKVDEFD